MFCPNCRSEYEEAVTTCADCGETLVAELPPEPQPEYVDYVTIFQTTDHNQVIVARSILASADIGTFVQGEDLQNMMPMATMMDVQVLAKDVEEAKRLLAEHGGLEYVPNEFTEDEEAPEQ